jgi:hypothetical protein
MLEVQAGVPVTEVAERFGVSRPAVRADVRTGLGRWHRHVQDLEVSMLAACGPAPAERAQTVLLDQMLPNSRGTVREDLLELAFRYNEFAGWLYQDAGDPDQAMHYTDRSSEYALVSRDPVNVIVVDR